VLKAEFFDSAFRKSSDLLPPSALAPSPATPTRESEIDIGDELVAMTIESAALRRQVLAALDGSVGLGGPETLARAAVVIVDAAGDVRRRIAQVRQRARPDAAIIVALEQTAPADVAAAIGAGAFACLRPPLVREELVSFVASARDSRAAKIQAADLARKLDLESHLASIGRITAGLAHEIGGPLNVATLNLQFIREELDRLLPALGAPPEVAGELRTAIEETGLAHARLGALLDAMRALVRKEGSTSSGAVDVLGAVHDVRRWLGAELQGIEIEMLGEPLRASADVTMLGQILHNLVANAAQAARTLPSPRLRLHVYAQGDRVVVSVRDNGPGIPVELHDKIFEPFFTTRRGQGGTGLGLALCLEYALQMRADLSLWSLPGRGTCFRLSLPRAE